MAFQMLAGECRKMILVALAAYLQHDGIRWLVPCRYHCDGLFVGFIYGRVMWMKMFAPRLSKSRPNRGDSCVARSRKHKV